MRKVRILAGATVLSVLPAMLMAFSFVAQRTAHKPSLSQSSSPWSVSSTTSSNHHHHHYRHHDSGLSRTPFGSRGRHHMTMLYSKSNKGGGGADDDEEFDFDFEGADFAEDFDPNAVEDPGEPGDDAVAAANADLDDVMVEEDEDVVEEDEYDEDDVVMEEEDYVDDEDDEYEYEYEYYEEEEEEEEDDLVDEDEEEDDGDIYLEADDDDEIEEYDEDGNPIPRKKKKKPKKPKKKKKISKASPARRSAGGASYYVGWDDSHLEYTDEDDDRYYKEWANAGLEDDFEDDEDEDAGLDQEEEDPNYLEQQRLIEEHAKFAEERVKRDNFNPIDLLTSPPGTEMDTFDEAAVLRLAKHTSARDGTGDNDEEYDEYDDFEAVKELIAPGPPGPDVPQLTAEDVGYDDDGFDDEVVETTLSTLDDNDDGDVALNPAFENDEVVEFVEGDMMKNMFNYSQEDLDMMESTMKDLDLALNDTSNPSPILELGMDGIEGLGFTNDELQEMVACANRIGSSSYNVTRYLLYDWNFNVTNLILSAFKHNPEAPIVLMHWYPQLLIYKRYQYARDRNFEFTWDDIESADVSELQRYFEGIGHKTIPTKAPHETGTISLEEMSEEDQKMAGFEAWFNEVYNPDMDRVDFDEPELDDEDNVFSEAFKYYNNPENPTIEDMDMDIDEWRDEVEEEMGPDLTEEQIEYQNMIGTAKEFKMYYDPEMEKLFRGHLVVACGREDSDLDVAEKITERMDQSFGKQVFVETRVMNNINPEDNVFEVWLESYEVDLLHSKRRASTGTEDWDGPMDCDEEQIESLVKEVGMRISDDFRYSYTSEVDAD